MGRYWGPGFLEFAVVAASAAAAAQMALAAVQPVHLVVGVGCWVVVVVVECGLGEGKIAVVVEIERNSGSSAVCGVVVMGFVDVASYAADNMDRLNDAEENSGEVAGYSDDACVGLAEEYPAIPLVVDCLQGGFAFACVVAEHVDSAAAPVAAAIVADAVAVALVGAAVAFSPGSAVVVVVVAAEVVPVAAARGDELGRKALGRQEE